MSDPQQRIEILVSKFQSDLVVLAHEIASDTIASALGGTNGHSNGHAAKKSANGHVFRHAGGAKNGAKRDPKVLAAIGDRFAAFVRAHPGLRIEQINKQIGATTAELALPIRKLIASGAIKVKGKKRSTTYFAGASGATSSKKGKAKIPSKKAVSKKAAPKKAPSKPTSEPKGEAKSEPN
jgi:hypothetical protein